MQAMLTNCRYLQDEEVVLDGVRFYGAPWQPEFCAWAFNVNRGRLLDQVPRAVCHGLPRAANAAG